MTLKCLLPNLIVILMMIYSYIAKQSSVLCCALVSL